MPSSISSSIRSLEAYKNSVFHLVCYIFGKSFVKFWAVKLPVTLSFVLLGVHYYGSFTFISGLNDYVVSFSKCFESFLFLLGQVICNLFIGLVCSISLVMRCMKGLSAGSLFLSGVHLLLRLNGLSSSGL